MRIIFILLLVIYFIRPGGSVMDHKSTMAIAGLFTEDQWQDEIAFQYAVDRINMDPTTLSKIKLVPIIERIPAGDSFEAGKKVCNLTALGIGAIFGPNDIASAGIVKSISETLEIPNLQTQWEITRHKFSPLTVKTYPEPKMLSQGLADLIEDMDWKSFTILYDTEESLIRLQGVLKLKGPSDPPVAVRQLDRDDDHRSILKEIQMSGESHIVLQCKPEKVLTVLRQAKEVKMMEDYQSYIITDLELSQHLAAISLKPLEGLDFVPQKNEMHNIAVAFLQYKLDWGNYPRKIFFVEGPSNEKESSSNGYKMDTHTIDFAEFKYGRTNITTVRLIDPSDLDVQNAVRDWVEGGRRNGIHINITTQTVKTETALLYDAVHLFAKALNMMDKDFPKDRLHPTPLRCDAAGTWSVGYALVNQMRRVEMKGMSGPMSFDPNYGRRTNFRLEIIELNKNGFKKIGTWDPINKVNYSRTIGEIYSQIVEKLENKTFIVVSRLGAPFLMLREPQIGLTGNDRFEGYSINLIDEIAKELNFKYEFTLTPDGKYGSYNKVTKKWDGLVKQLLDRKADLAICDLTITYERETAVDFTMPFMTLGISILYSKPIKQPPNLFSFLSPFSGHVWMYMATAYLGVSLFLFILARMTPFEWENPHPCNDNCDELESKFNLVNCLWFSLGSLMGQGCDILPKISPLEWTKARPLKIESKELETNMNFSNSIWHNCGSLMQQGSDIAPKAVSTRLVAGMWWFFTLIMISSYTANLAAFLTVERMDVAITSAEDLAKQTRIKYGAVTGGSTAAFFKRMWAAMESARPSVFTTSNAEGVERVLKGKRSYAFLMESTSIEYQVERNCDLQQIGELLDSKGYGIAMPVNSPYRTAISGAVLKMQEDGRLHMLKEKWWKEMYGGGSCKDEHGSGNAASQAELGLANVGGVFVVLVLGCAAGFIMAVMEFLWNIRKIVVEEEISPKEALMKELKFALSCTGSKKPVRKKKQSAKASQSSVSSMQLNHYD